MESRTGRHWAWVATLGLGVGMVLWILLEVLLIPDRSVIEVIYGFMGLALAVLSLTPSVRSHLSLRR